MLQPIGSAATRVVERLAGRRDRDRQRAERARAAVLADPHADALAPARAMIDAAFGEAAIHNAFKLRVEHYLRLGTGHPAVRARYGARAQMIAESIAIARAESADTGIAVAINMVERWYRTERKAFQIASVFGRATRLSVEILAELRLILRLIRRSEFRDQFPGIVDFVIGDSVAASEYAR